MLSRVLSALELKLPPSPPTSHIPALLDHIVSLLSNSSAPASLSMDTLAFLRPIVPSALSTISRTAEGLYDILALPTTMERTKHPLLTLPPAPLAPALLLLALEANSKPPRAAPHILALAAHLGARLGAAGTTVMERYRALCDVVCGGMDDVPWLAISTVTKSKTKSAAGKGHRTKGEAAKIARRTMVARAVVDVVQFRETLWKQRVKEGGPVTVVLEVDADEDSKSDKGQVVQRGEPLDAPLPDIGVKRKRLDADPKTTGYARKMKKPRTAQGLAARFLLNPLGTPLSSLFLPNKPLSLSHTTHLLAPEVEVGLNAPTRLQLLCSGRGGEVDIRDEELFAEGELEDILVCAPTECEDGASYDHKGREEWERRQAMFNEMWKEEDGKEAERAQAKERRGRREMQAHRSKGKGKSRVNMEALERVLRGGLDETGQAVVVGFGLDVSIGIDTDSLTEFESDEHGSEEGDREDDWDDSGWRGSGTRTPDADVVVEVAAWRPVSPGGGSWDDRYDL
ncbi:hypothetical protein OF83DRAFT_1119074 [Amylostereum chailletii]|nr:hypothetical protein OF83DRAFT_1119074 [Amylostereum chailletii]